MVHSTLTFSICMGRGVMGHSSGNYSNQDILISTIWELLCTYLQFLVFYGLVTLLVALLYVRGLKWLCHILFIHFIAL